MSVCPSVCNVVSEPRLLKDFFNSRREILLNFQENFNLGYNLTRKF
jgi:hypothetical protein